ncbi:MAG: hypothetical protein L0Z50_29510 [Verrucomicrobiales bacterium]|nr:hypothetical protein [Verrucomicrobiales bacterium]
MEHSRFLPLLIGSGGLLLGALFVVIGSHLWRDGRELRRLGKTVRATVQMKFCKEDDRSWAGFENYYLRCILPGTNGQMHLLELKVKSKVWRGLKEGGSVALTWLPGRLDSTKIGPLWGRRLRGFVGATMIGFGAVAAMIFPIGGLLEFFRGGHGNP